jgi:hypothetical protein
MSVVSTTAKTTAPIVGRKSRSSRLRMVAAMPSRVSIRERARTKPLMMKNR